MVAQRVLVRNHPVFSYFRCSEKTLIAESKFQLIAVMPLFIRAGYRQENGISDLPDAAKILFGFLLLVLQLLFVGQHLPFAAAAYAEVNAKRFYAVRRWERDADHTGFGPVFFVFGE